VKVAKLDRDRSRQRHGRDQGKRQKAKVGEEILFRLLPFAFCLLPFALIAATPPQSAEASASPSP
jgi:hypothetical protein